MAVNASGMVCPNRIAISEGIRDESVKLADQVPQKGPQRK